MYRRTLLRIAAAFAACLASGNAPGANAEFITLVSTTSTDNSGLYQRILPIFTQRTGIAVRVVAVGTGQAIRIARNGDADVLLVHHRPSEEAFVREGFGVRRFDVMYNDFIIVGPGTDPAGIRSAQSVGEALRRISNSAALFISRGDDSGTHKREMELWRSIGIDPTGDSGGWYQEAGAGMGATLNVAVAKGAYTLSDRGTWLSFTRRADLELLSPSDRQLLNPYGVILVNPARFAHVKAREGQMFIDWLRSAEGQRAIADYRINGEQLFFPNAGGSS